MPWENGGRLISVTFGEKSPTLVGDFSYLYRHIIHTLRKFSLKTTNCWVTMSWPLIKIGGSSVGTGNRTRYLSHSKRKRNNVCLSSSQRYYSSQPWRPQQSYFVAIWLTTRFKSSSDKSMLSVYSSVSSQHASLDAFPHISDGTRPDGGGRASKVGPQVILLLFSQEGGGSFHNLRKNEAITSKYSMKKSFHFRLYVFKRIQWNERELSMLDAQNLPPLRKIWDFTECKSRSHSAQPEICKEVLQVEFYWINVDGKKHPCASVRKKGVLHFPLLKEVHCFTVAHCIK